MAPEPIPFVPPIEVEHGRCEQVSPLVQRVTAGNPSKYTYLGTGTYIVGSADVAVIDPGPELASHREALGRALAGRRVRSILVTHCHSDHSPLAAWLREWSDAPTFALGPHAGSPDDDVAHLDDGLGDEAGDGHDDSGEEPKESIDWAFRPDEPVVDGAVVSGPGWTFDVVATPGHTSNHACWSLREESTLFTGDHVMGWSTTVVAPPDGDMREYCESLRRLLGRGDRWFRPTHGGPVAETERFVAALLAHRLEREAQVLAALAAAPRRIPEIVAELYSAVRPELHRAAGRSVYSHLVKLVEDGLVEVVSPSGGGVVTGPPSMRDSFGRR